MILVDTGKMKMTLSGTPEPEKGVDHDGKSVFRQIAVGSDIVETDLLIEGTEDVIWPNREGERLSVGEAFSRLTELNDGSSGLSLCWPATASVQAIGMTDGNRIHTFLANPDSRGRTRFLYLHSSEPGVVRFIFKGTSVTWRLLTSELPDQKEGDTGIQRSLYQVGLIGPLGESEVPKDRGFSILGDAARALIHVFGTPVPGDIIHIFGYGEGHDRGYPDYTPSVKLGGTPSLKSAIAELGLLGFQVSLYLNARLAERSRLCDYPELQNAVLHDKDGGEIVEEYHVREFAVMNPSSSLWTNHLLEEVHKLKKLGVSWIQLDQVAGRAAPVAPGSDWGEGYRRLIENIRKLGLKVWIQGVSDYYPADAFEATWRPVNVLEDGTLRGGWPLGVPDTSLIESAGFNGSLIVPAAKEKALKMSGLTLVHDRSANEDRLPLWGQSWLNTINKYNYSRVPGELNGGIQ